MLLLLDLPTDLAEQPRERPRERSREWPGQAVDTRGFIPERVNMHIARRYRIDKQEIGEGAYGRVFVGEDRDVRGRMVAIKKVTAVRMCRKAAFDREATVMKQLDHPNICKLLETYTEGTSMFLVMEYCDGGELFEHITKGGNLGLSEAACGDVVRQIAGALKYAHGRGIAHRDLKPENVCLCTDSVPGGRGAAGRKKTHVKVIDWGLSAFFGAMDARMRTNVGSVAYAAPEVLEGSHASDGYTSACDLWSLGVLTYVCLSARFPFPGRNSYEQLNRVRAAEFNFAGVSWARISADAKDLINMLLRSDAGLRLTAAGVLAHPWLRRTSGRPNLESTRRVLSNVHNARRATFPASVYAALVARQLDHQGLKELPQVFLDLDLDGNGLLELSEVRRGFESVFGKDCKEIVDIDRTFGLLDLDGSGTIDYTEFCAAGLGERLRSEEHALKAAFKAFDIHDDNGRITREEFEEVMANAHVSEVHVAADKVFSEFDRDGDGSLNFEEWSAWIGELFLEGHTKPAN